MLHADPKVMYPTLTTLGMSYDDKDDESYLALILITVIYVF